MRAGGDAAAATRPPHVAILVLNRVGDDPRVRRQIESFRQAGWDVTAIGLGGSRTPPPACRLDLVEPEPGRANRPNPLARWSGHLRRAFSLRLGGRAADAAFWRVDRQLPAIRERAGRCRPDLWIANDWTMLPIAVDCSSRTAAPFIYDSHELATEEFNESWKWRWFMRGLVRHVEATAIARAACVSTVSQPIAERLRALYPQTAESIVVRNAPFHQACPFRPAGDPIGVLYQGAVFPGRGLEAAIESVAAWRSEFELTIRGPVDDGYRDRLVRLAETHGVGKRVRFLAPVPVTELVAAANAFDIGLSLLPQASANNQAALPNKAFEYLMAGVALCVTDLPALARLVERYGVGHVVADGSPAAIAAAVNRFDRHSLDLLKQRALAAARELCWETEFAPLLERSASLAAGAIAAAAAAAT